MAELPVHVARLEAERLRPTRDERSDAADLLGQLIEILATGLFGIRRVTDDSGRAIGGGGQRAPRVPDLWRGSR